MIEEARKKRTEIFEEVIETIDAWAYDQGQGERDLRARLAKIEEHLTREKQMREENVRLQGEKMRMQAEICRLPGAKEEKQWNEVYCFVRNRLEWGRDQEETEEKESRKRGAIHEAAEQAAKMWRMKKELREGWGGFEEREDAGMQMGTVTAQMMAAMQEVRSLVAEIASTKKMGKDTYAAVQGMAKGMTRTTEAIDKMKKEMEDLEAEVGNELEKLTRAVERVERKGAPTPSPPPMARDMQHEALMRRLNTPPPTTPTDSKASSPAPTRHGNVPPALPRAQQVEAARARRAKEQPATAEGQAATAEAEANETKGLTEQEMIDRDLGGGIRRSIIPALPVDWSGTEEGEEEETKDVEMGEADTIHPERREQIEREESKDTPIPQQPARPLWPVGPRVQDMNIAQQRHHRQRLAAAEEARKAWERGAGQKVGGEGRMTYAQQLRDPAPRHKTKEVRKGKEKEEKNPLEQIKGSIPVDERMIVFERRPGVEQLDWLTVNQITSHINNSLSKVAPPHVRTEKFKVSRRGVLSTTARRGASAAMLLHFKKELIEAVRKGDDAIINVRSNESWVELKILVPYAAYRDEEGIS